MGETQKDKEGVRRTADALTFNFYVKFHAFHFASSTEEFHAIVTRGRNDEVDSRKSRMIARNSQFVIRQSPL